MGAVLELRNVSKTFKISTGLFGQIKKLQAVDGADLALEAGESLGLVGESGCGKSTLGRLASGLLAPDKGAIDFMNRPLPLAKGGSWAAGKIQMIFQDPASSLNPRMSVLSSVAEPLAALGQKAGVARERAADMLELVGLKDMGNRYPHQFSGGQRQRIAVARALVSKPEIIVCDEPVSALDASVQAQILNLLTEAREKFGPAYLFISHDLAVIGFMCSRIMVMYLGRIVEEAKREQLFQSPAHPYTQALMAAMPCGVKAWEQGRGLDKTYALKGELPSPLNPPQGCYFHPRCPRAAEICVREAPVWTRIAQDWKVRCHFPTLPQ